MTACQMSCEHAANTKSLAALLKYAEGVSADLGLAYESSVIRHLWAGIAVTPFGAEKATADAPFDHMAGCQPGSSSKS